MCAHPVVHMSLAAIVYKTKTTGKNKWQKTKVGKKKKEIADGKLPATSIKLTVNVEKTFLMGNSC